MTFIATVDPQAARGQLADVYTRIAQARGGVADLLVAHSLNPSAMVAQFDLYATLMFAQSELDRRTREMIAVVVSVTNGCSYCTAHQSEALRQLGVPTALVETLGAGQLPDEYVSLPVQALLAFARALTVAPAPDPDAIAELRALGWSDAAILDAVLVASFFNNLNRVTLALGVALEPAFAATCQPELG